MSEAAAAIVVAFQAGVMLGIGLETAQWNLVIGAVVLLFLTVYYYHRFVKPKEMDK